MPQIARTSAHRSKPPSEHSSAHPKHSLLNISHLRSSRSHWAARATRRAQGGAPNRWAFATAVQAMKMRDLRRRGGPPPVVFAVDPASIIVF